MKLHRFVLPQYKLPVHGEWVIIKETDLQKFNKVRHNLWDYIIGEYQRNPLSFYLPHGKKRKGGGNDGLAFMNDWENDLLLLTAPKQTGKTHQGAAKMLFYSIPCDPEWPCFKEHGIIYKPWSGPKDIIIASYSWDNVKIVWETYRQICPRDELQEFSLNYGRFPDERGKPRDLMFHNIGKSIRLKCGTLLTFLCYTQSNVHFESRQADAAHLDEQSPEDKFSGVTSRMNTRGSYTPIIMTLTGYVVDNRPDTGAQGWIKRKIVDGKETRGRKVASYQISMESVPDAIIGKDKKKQLHYHWVVEPEKTKNEKMKREAQAVYYGGWEVGGGVIMSEWNPDIHMIEPFDLKRYHPTYYRVIDHGESPMAGVFLAVLPWGDAVMYAEYYESGRTIDQNVVAMLQLVGNRRIRVDDVEQSESWPIWQEEEIGTQFRASELDSRCFHKRSPESGRTLGQVYNESGWYCTPACANRDYANNSNKGTIPLMKEWFQIEPSRQHINTRLKRPYAYEGYGAPRIYIFNTCQNFKMEIQGWVDDASPHHTLDALKYYCARVRPYMGSEVDGEENESPIMNQETGY